jgi:GT2 family glycosyltransferase
MISVVVVNWNGKKYLETCLGSLFNQSLNKEEYEVILVDNASTDGSVKFVKENFPLVRVIELNENVGFSKGNNIGVSNSIGELIAFLNNDTEVNKDWLYELKKAADEHPEASFFASKILFFDKRDIIDSAGDFFSLKGYGYKRGHGEKDIGQYNKEEIIFGVCGCACMFRKEVFKELGGFDEDFFAYCEDVDLNFRCNIRGYKCLYVPTAITYHKLGGSFGISSDTHIYYTQRNQEFVLIKNANLKYHIVHIFVNIYSLFKHLFKGKIKIFLKAKIDALKYFPIMFKKRKEFFSKKVLIVKDEIEELLDRFNKESYPVFFINKEKYKEILEKKNVLSNIIGMAEEFLKKSKVNDALDLITLGESFWLKGDKRLFNLFIKEFLKFIEEFNFESKTMLYLIYSYYFFKDIEVPKEIKKKFLKVLIDYTKKECLQDSKIEYLINRTILLLISTCFPYIINKDNFIDELIKMIDSEGIVSKEDIEFNISFLEIFTMVYSIARLKHKKVSKDELNKVNKTFEFVINLVKPNGKYGIKKILPLDNNLDIDLDYILSLKFIVEDDFNRMFESKYFKSCLLLYGDFQIKEGLKLPKIEIQPDSCGYSKNKIYIMKNSSNFLFTDILTYSIFTKGKDLILRNSNRCLEIDDGLIRYDRNFKTNLWIAGIEYDFLDVQYELTPSVVHKKQFYFNKKENYWIIRDTLLGKEEHLVKVRFFINSALKITNINTYINKLSIRDYINKFLHGNRLEGSYLKLSPEETLGVSINDEYVIIPLNNPNLVRTIDNGLIEYSTSFILPNEVVFLIF